MPPNNLPHSKAFAEYLANRQTIIDLLKSAPPDNEQLLSSKKRTLANGIHRSCVLLLASYLERYVESLVVEAIDALNNANLLVQSIPESLRLSQVKESLSELSLCLQKDMTKDNAAKTLRLSQSILVKYDWFLDDLRPFGKLIGEPLIGGTRFSNPSPEKVEELFRHLGINSVVGRVIGLEKKPDKSAVRDKVKEMIDKRNDIAHTGGTVTVTKQDVADYLHYCRRLVRGLDVLVGQDVQKMIGGVWPWS